MNYEFKSAKDSFLARIVGFFMPEGTWFTYRLPFQEKCTVVHPANADPKDPKFAYIVAHEEVHVVDLMKSNWAPIKMLLLYILFPLPIFFSGRWFIEREAYLLNIIKHGFPVQSVVDQLWYNYYWPWPRSWMLKWFEEKLGHRP